MMNSDFTYESKEQFIATFFSHFGAIRFSRDCRGKAENIRLMPVPRNLSSSCGTCVIYESTRACPTGCWRDEVEQVVRVCPSEKGYEVIYQA